MQLDPRLEDMRQLATLLATKVVQSAESADQRGQDLEFYAALSLARVFLTRFGVDELKPTIYGTAGTR